MHKIKAAPQAEHAYLPACSVAGYPPSSKPHQPEKDYNKHECKTTQLRHGPVLKPSQAGQSSKTRRCSPVAGRPDPPTFPLYKVQGLRGSRSAEPTGGTLVADTNKARRRLAETAAAWRAVSASTRLPSTLQDPLPQRQLLYTGPAWRDRAGPGRRWARGRRESVTLHKLRADGRSDSDHREQAGAAGPVPGHRRDE